MLVQAKQGKSSIPVFSLILTAILSALLTLELVCVVLGDKLGIDWKESYSLAFYISFPILYVIYLFECLSSPWSQYLFNDLDFAGYQNYLNDIKKIRPKIEFSIECWHEEVEHIDETWTDSQGNTQTRTVQRTHKVVTYTGREAFVYQSFEDETGIPTGIHQDKVTQLRLHQSIIFADQATQKAFNTQFGHFITRNKDRDKNHTTSEHKEIPGLRERILIIEKNSRQRRFLNLWCYWIFSLVLASWVYRLIFESMVDHKEITVVKKVSIHPPNFESPNPHNVIELTPQPLIIGHRDQCNAFSNV